MKTAILAGAILATVALDAFATDLVLEGGAGVDGSPAARVGLRFPTKWEWLNTEVGALATKGGGIVDVTPMFRLFKVGQHASVEAGIGLGDNFINNPDQGQGLIFRDVLRVNYDRFFVEAAHYSNGGSLNPLFGTPNNEGFSYVLAGVKFKF